MGKIYKHFIGGFTTLPNAVVENPELSLKAKALFWFFFSRPDDWEYSIEGTSRIIKEGKESIRNAAQELEAHGYLIREQKVTEQGRYSCADYHLYAEPIVGKKPMSENQTTENPRQPIKDLPNNNRPNKEIDISTLRSDISSKKNQENGRLSSQEIVDLYNSICTSMPKCIKLNEARLSAISAIRKEFSDSQIEDAFRKAEASDFLTLRSGSDWTGANFDWLMTKKHMLRVLEGIYNRTIAKPNNNNDIFGPNRKIRM